MIETLDFALVEGTYDGRPATLYWTPAGGIEGSPVEAVVDALVAETLRLPLPLAVGYQPRPASTRTPLDALRLLLAVLDVSPTVIAGPPEEETDDLPEGAIP